MQKCHEKHIIGYHNIITNNSVIVFLSVLRFLVEYKTLKANYIYLTHFRSKLVKLTLHSYGKHGTFYYLIVITTTFMFGETVYHCTK